MGTLSKQRSRSLPSDLQEVHFLRHFSVCVFSDTPFAAQCLLEKKQEKLKKAAEKARDSVSKLNELMKTISASAGELSLTCSEGLGAPAWPCRGALPSGSAVHAQLTSPANLLLSHRSAATAHKWDFFPVHLPQNKMVLLHVYDTL